MRLQRRSKVTRSEPGSQQTLSFLHALTHEPLQKHLGFLPNKTPSVLAVSCGGAGHWKLSFSTTAA